MRARLLAALLAAAPTGAAASSFGPSQAGTSAATFLTEGADARAAGMGNAVAASADDASGVYWNPADLAGVHYRDATFTHTASYQGSFYDFLGYAQPIEVSHGTGRERDLVPDQLGTIAASIQYLNAGKLTEVDNTGAPTGGSFTPQDFAATVGWGAELARGLDVGVSVKYVSTQIEESAATGAADFGARWRAQVPGTEIGYALSAVVRDIGGTLKLHEGSDPLPTTVVIGQALHPVHSVTVDLDMNVPRDASPYVSFGAEWRAPMTEGVTAALRLGYDGRLSSGDVGGMTGITVGAGIGFQRLGFDYAWSPAGTLGDTQKLSLSYRF